MMNNLNYSIALSVLLGASLISSSVSAATKLSDRALRQETETSHSNTNATKVIDCSKNMSKEQCNRLQYERYAKQTGVSYDEFLRTETVNPLRNQVIKQPLLTQPLENPSVPTPPRPNLPDLLNQIQSPDRLPPATVLPTP